jgi:DNA polymerase-3 subunit delta'
MAHGMWSVVGFENQKKYFDQLLSRGELSHAYIFSGPDKIGKKTFAQELCVNINGRKIQSDVDFFFVAPKREEGETKIYIEDIRKLKSSLMYKPVLGPYKLILIDDADRLTEEASNAFLKILEEPPSFSIFILITSRPQFLLPTISSRCQDVSFLSHDKKFVQKAIPTNGASKEDEELLLLLAGGRIGWALDVVNSKRLSEVKKDIKEFQSIIKKDIFERMQYAKNLCRNHNLIGDWLSRISSLIYSFFCTSF